MYDCSKNQCRLLFLSSGKLQEEPRIFLFCGSSKDFLALIFTWIPSDGHHRRWSIYISSIKAFLKNLLEVLFIRSITWKNKARHAAKDGNIALWQSACLACGSSRLNSQKPSPTHAYTHALGIRSLSSICSVNIKEIAGILSWWIEDNKKHSEMSSVFKAKSKIWYSRTQSWFQLHSMYLVF